MLVCWNRPWQVRTRREIEAIATKKEQLATGQAAFRRRRSVEWEREVASGQAGRILGRTLSHYSRRRDLAHQGAKLEAVPEQALTTHAAAPTGRTMNFSSSVTV
jgi:hypothetical protein